MKDFEKLMFVIVDKKGNVLPHTLSEQRKECIRSFLQDGNVLWKDVKHIWHIKKVDVSIRNSSNSEGWN